MKLRNKKTREMGIINYFDNQSIVIYPIDENWNAKGDKKYVYHSLTELNEEWEDYGDELFYIVSAEHKDGYICALKEDYKELCDVAKKLGIGFETEKEARQAVEKLKAWKRLKDKGFRFEYYDYSDRDLHNHIQIKAITNREVEDSMLCKEDLDLLFSQEDD